MLAVIIMIITNNPQARLGKTGTSPSSYSQQTVWLRGAELDGTAACRHGICTLHFSLFEHRMYKYCCKEISSIFPTTYLAGQ